MPIGAYQECRKPRCPNYAERGGYCREHAKAQRPEFIDAVGRLQKSARFRRLRHSFLVRNPVCAKCQREPAQILDHRIPHRGALRLFWDQRNWQGLCTHCHAVKTAAEVQFGGSA